MAKRKLISLTITDTCNLKCIYCYQSQEAHNTKTLMSFDTAKNILLKYFNNPGEFEEIEIDFFGGEPFVNKELIVNLVEWTMSQEFKIPFIFFVSTNGTLVKGRIKEWLEKNKKYIILGLSLDGKPSTHNMHRSNSYNRIDIDFFLNTYPNQPVRMTIVDSSIDSLYEDITHMHKLGFKVDAAFDQNFQAKKVSKKEYAEQLALLCEFYLSNPDIEPCSLLNRPIPNLLVAKKNTIKWCGAGTSMVSIDTEGNEYPCQSFQPNTFSPNTAYKKSIFPIDQFKEVSRDKFCEDCILEPICPTCYGMNLIREGNLYTRNKEMCEINKITALAVSYLRGKQIENGQIYLSPRKLSETIETIELIQDEFKEKIFF